ncbi:hypothetical protein, partial [Haloferax profundi]|uniref:hypothetical protein n=1 Tax=Haloferax profundi TaxID=1544718 RepID=UPI000B193B5C
REQRIEDDCRQLLESGSLETFHWYKQQLERIGPGTIVEGIQKLDREKLGDLTDDEMGDKVSLILYFIEWEWEDEVELIRSLQDFKRKRTYERKRIDGERSFDGLGEEVIEAIEDAVWDVLPDVNDHQRHKVTLNRVDILDEQTLIVRFYAESRSSSYRQFTFRDDQTDSEFTGPREAEVKSHNYWPVVTEHIYLDYGRNEYYAEIKRSVEQLLSPVIEVLYEGDVEYGKRVRFADPLDPDNTGSPEDFVSERADEYRERLEKQDVFDEEQTEQYKQILENIESVEQTRIRLEQVDVEGNLRTFVIETEEDVSEFLDAFSLGDRVEKFNQKSRTREYTLQLGDLEVDVSGTKISIAGDVTEDQERVLTALLREGEEVV